MKRSIVTVAACGNNQRFNQLQELKERKKRKELKNKYDALFCRAFFICSQ